MIFLRGTHQQIELLRTALSIVMAGHSRPKDGVASLAYVPAIPILGARLYLLNRVMLR